MKKVAFLTSGGIAPCLTSSIASLIDYYNKTGENFKYLGYRYGYYGLLKNNSFELKFSNVDLQQMKSWGGTILGNSRVKLSNIEDCLKNGYINKGEDPFKIAAHQLVADKVNILHTIGGDDTNTTASDLSNYLNNNGYKLTVVGLPKTIDNDVFPISQTLGADTAAEQGSIFFENIVNENTTSRRQLIIHEIMGRNCGWLTAYTAKYYRKKLDKKIFLTNNGLKKEQWDIHAVYIPEIGIDTKVESLRLKKIMDKYDCVNVFLSEGAGIDNIVKDLELKGKKLNRDAFGHLRLDELNPGKWYSDKIAQWTNAKKILVQKSGYFCRSAAPNKYDLSLIDRVSKKAVKYALKSISGVVGPSDNLDGKIDCINFKKIKGGKPFDFKLPWYKNILTNIGQK